MGWEKFKQRVLSMNTKDEDKRFYNYFLDLLCSGGFPIPRHVWPNHDCSKLNLMFHIGGNDAIWIELKGDGTGTICLEKQPFNPSKEDELNEGK